MPRPVSIAMLLVFGAVLAAPRLVLARGGKLVSNPYLTRGQLTAGIATVRGPVAGCAAKSPAKGTVKIVVVVAPKGTVARATVRETPDAALGACVAAAVKKATFARTPRGGTFLYPFEF